MIRVEIVYAEPQRSVIKSLSVARDAVVEDVLRAVAADQDFHGVDVANAAVGIFGKVAPRDQALKDGDRIEIYRPLLQEPKLARRTRAKTARKHGQ